VNAYVKTATGETLTYRPPDLHRYAGEQFCLRITPEDIDLDRCFFVYLDERFEGYSLRKLFEEYFFAPGPDQEAEMESWMEQWQHMDPMLPKKRMLLRQMFAKVRAQSGKVLFYINHGPGPVNPEDTVRSHLGTSVFDDGSFDDKVLDVVLEFYADEEPLPELDQWAQFEPTDTANAGLESAPARTNRRGILALLAVALLGVLSLPFLLFRRRQVPPGEQRKNGNPAGGFWGGML
jgi:hypothetical protein